MFESPDWNLKNCLLRLFYKLKIFSIPFAFKYPDDIQRLKHVQFFKTMIKSKKSIKYPYDVKKLLVTAIEIELLDIVNILIKVVKMQGDIDFDIHFDDKYRDNSTILHLAACIGNIKIIDILIKNGCDIDARDTSGSTALFAADKFEVVAFLINRGADWTIRGSKDLLFCRDDYYHIDPWVFGSSKKKIIEYFSKYYYK